MNDVVKFDTNALKTRISERIRGNFIELIPDEAFDALVTAEIKDFTSIQNRSGYSSNDRYSDLQKMIKDELRDRYRALIKQKFDDPEFFKQVWNQECQGESVEGIIGDNINKFIEENAGVLLMNMFKPMISQLMFNVRNQIASNNF